jgi:HEAT repeat protein/sugar phosphate permease
VETTIEAAKPAAGQPTTAEKIRKLPWALFAAGTNTVFAQFTVMGSVFILFLNSLGLSKTSIGLLLSFFPFFGLTALFTAPAVARFGYKRTYLTFWTARKFVTAGLLLTPWVLATLGTAAASIFVGALVAAFAICRAIGETGSYPWIQEYIPASVRGKYSASENTIGTLASLAAVAAAGYVIGHVPGINGFMLLLAVGVAFGLISVWGASHLPGGAPIRGPVDARPLNIRLAEPARNPDFRWYLIGAGLLTLAWTPLGSFLPLFMNEQVGLSDSQVVLLQTGTLIGGLVSAYVWGWAADRYGSRPVMLSGLYLYAVLPIFWLLMPRHSGLSMPVALAIALLQGLVVLGWNIGAARLLFVNLVPPDKKTDYMALHYAWMGAVGGLSQLLAGRLIDLTRGVTGQIGAITLDPYTPLFVASIGLPLIAGVLLSRIQAGSRYTVTEFAGMFFQGNPFMAAESLIRYGRARDEEATVSLTERLGEAKSPLTVEELFEALADPRFNVRFEAILAMARLPAEARVIEALADIVSQSEPALSVVAAWALGRLGDPRAIAPLRDGLRSQYRSVQAHSARALGTLHDTELEGALLQRFLIEKDHGLRMAYASALGKLDAQEALTPLLAFLRSRQEPGASAELALVVARLLGDEPYFVQLWRQMRQETGTGLSQAVSGLRRRLEHSRLAHGASTALPACADAFARNDLAHGAAQLGSLLRQLLAEPLDPSTATVLAECADRLEEFKAERLEYVLLALHALHSAAA